MLRRILITGAAGFIGSHLARRLIREGHEVHGVHRSGNDLHRVGDLSGNIRLWTCDLLDSDRLRFVLKEVQPHIIYHLAGDTSLRHTGRSLTSTVASLEGNLGCSVGLFIAASSSPDLQLLVRLGGLEEYGRGTVPYVESQREQPVSPYSASQVAATHYLQMLAPHVSYRAVTLRPALIYGPMQSLQFFVPSLIWHCLSARDFKMSFGHHGRDLLYVDDLVEALVLLLHKPLITGELLNIGSGREFIIEEVAAVIIQLTGATIRLIREKLIPLSPVEHLYCSHAKASRLLGWRPLTDLQAGLRRTIESMRLTHLPAFPL